MHKRIFIALFSLGFLFLQAQENSASPYSFYGLGENKLKGAQENRAMGGVSVFKDSLRMNFQNPASYAFLNRTSFTVGLNHNRASQETVNTSGDVQKTNFDYLAIGIPMGKFAASVGLMPFSGVGYKLLNISTDAQGLQRTRVFDGTGGVNRVYGALGYTVAKDFNIGVDFSYNFGDIETKSVEYITGVQYGTRELNRTDVSGSEVNIGAMYNTKLNEKYRLFFSATYKPETRFTLNNVSNLAIVQGGASLDLEIPIEELETRNEKRTLRNPSRFSVGAGFGDVNKFVFGTELTLTQSNAFANRFDEINNLEFENAMKVGVGGYFIPKYNAFSGYWNRVVYRGGLFYENTGMVINDETINNYGITFGLGLPVTGSFSNINIGFEFGTRGTTNAGLVKENYMNLMISLALNDKWFVRSKYY